MSPTDIDVTAEKDDIVVIVDPLPPVTLVTATTPDVIVLAAGNVGSPGPPGPTGPPGPAGSGEGLPADTVIPAGTRILANKLLVGDAQPSFRMMGNGKLEWGPGGSSAPDTVLYRDPSNTGWLATDGGFWVSAAGSGQGLGTEGVLWIQRANLTAPALEIYAPTDVHFRLSVKGDGKFTWADGANPADTNLYRIWAGGLKTDGALVSKRGFMVDLADEEAYIMSAWMQGESNDRFEIRSKGDHWWGPGGATGTDVGLIRSAPGRLRIQDVATVGYMQLAVNGSWPYITLSAPPGSDIGAGISFLSQDAGAKWDIYTMGSVPTQMGLHFYCAEINADAYRMTNNAFMIYGSRQLQFGDTGDTNLYRDATNVLATDDQLHVKNANGIKFNDGSVQTTAVAVGTTPPASPVVNQLWVDTT